MRPILLILGDIRIEHTLFALPFAVMSAFMAAGGMPETGRLVLVIVALFFARSAAMAFNRLTDARFDKTNPRTVRRPLATGIARNRHYWIFVLANSAGFIIAAWFINRLAFMLSPVALAIVFFYSFTKRFTPYSHFFLGAALSLAPIGAWVAVRGELGAASFVLGGAVIFWLVGLDIIYSCQDVEHDKKTGLFSLPSYFGVERALGLSSLAHMGMILMLFLLPLFLPDLGYIYYAGVALTAALLWYEHGLVRPDDLQKVNVAFFNVNGIISVGLMLFVITDALL